MTPDTPEPEAPEPGSPPRSDAEPPRPPRVLVSVGDLEDPAEWDVILVENQAVDDDTARRIAAERAGRPLQPMRRLGPVPPEATVTLPSLDERDVMQAFDTDRDAEDPAAISETAFAPPEDATPLRPRLAPPELPPDIGAFADVPEPGFDDPEDAREAVGTELAPDDQAEAEAAGEEVADEAAVTEPDPAAGARAWEPDSLTLPWEPPAREAAGPVLLDDPDDEFYAIAADRPTGAAADAEPPAEATAADGAADDDGPMADGAESDPTEADAGEDDGGDEEPAGDGWDPEATSLEERELLDDPQDLFYAVGRARVAAFKPSEPPGGISLPAPTAPLRSDLWGTDITAPVEQEEEVFEEELEIDSSFPLGPDDLVTAREVEPVQLDELDYANVFGPVAGGTRRVKDLAPHDPRRKPRPAYDGALYVFDDDEHRPVPVPRKGGRRRELVALGLAAGVIVALGVGSQVFTGDDRPERTAGPASTTTTVVRARSSDTSVPDLTLPTAPSESTVLPADDGTTQTTRRRTTTTVRRNGPTTPQQPTTTAAPATTAAPTTTSPPVTEAPSTTQAPSSTVPGDQEGV